MNREELVAAVHAGTDGLRGLAAANVAIEVMIKTITGACGPPVTLRQNRDSPTQ